MLQQTFGEKEPDIAYRERTGAYAIMFDKEDRVATVKLATGYFLPGGGLEENETHEMCIVRECLEEMGCTVEVGAFICKGDKYGWSHGFQDYLHGTGYFYIATLREKVATPIEIDHELVWLSTTQCETALFLEHQAWAVAEAAKVHKKKGERL